MWRKWFTAEKMVTHVFTNTETLQESECRPGADVMGTKVQGHSNVRAASALVNVCKEGKDESLATMTHPRSCLQ